VLSDIHGADMLPRRQVASIGTRVLYVRLTQRYRRLGDVGPRSKKKEWGERGEKGKSRDSIEIEANDRMRR
jgi:hypothetical protein